MYLFRVFPRSNLPFPFSPSSVDSSHKCFTSLTSILYIAFNKLRKMSCPESSRKKPSHHRKLCRQYSCPCQIVKKLRNSSSGKIELKKLFMLKEVGPSHVFTIFSLDHASYVHTQEHVHVFYKKMVHKKLELR